MLGTDKQYLRYFTSELTRAKRYFGINQFSTFSKRKNSINSFSNISLLKFDIDQAYLENTKFYGYKDK